MDSTIQNTTSYAKTHEVSKPITVNRQFVVPIKSEHDSVSFSSTSKEKKQNFIQKNWGKLLIGAAAITAGVMLTRGKLWNKPPSFEKVTQNLAEIFGKKNLSKEEAEAMLKKYKDIYKIEDTDKFIDTAFNTIKEDFGYKDVKIELHKVTELIDNGGMKGLGSFNPNFITIYKNNSRESILNIFTHEFNHLRQTEHMIRADIFDEKFVENGIRKLGANRKADVLEWLEDVKQNLGFHKKPKYAKDSAEYKKALDYLDLFDPDYVKNYDQNRCEVESKSIGKKMSSVVDYITQSLSK